MFELQAGRFDLPESGLCFELPAPVHIPAYSCIAVRGENGVGKTMFLEHVLLSQLAAYQVLYVAQDIDVQVNTMRATLAFLDHQAPSGLTDLVQAWICAASGASVLILDEFDTYMPQGLPAEILLSFAWVFFVSHQHTPAVYARFQHGLAVQLTRPAHGQTVQMNVEELWSRSR